MGLEFAARLGDPIAHTSREGWGTALAILGAVVGAVIVVATAPVSIPTLAVAATVAAGATATVATTTVIGAGVGELIGSTQTDAAAGYIADGASTVFIGPELAEAARMSDPVDCHPGKKIADGSDSVFIEGWNASRKTDQTWCAGTISDGCRSVLIGGERIGQAGSEERSELSEGYRTTLTVIDWAGTIASLGGAKTAREVALWALGAGAKLYGAVGPEGAENQGRVAGAIITGLSIVTGRPSEWDFRAATDNLGAAANAGLDLDKVRTDTGPPRTYSNLGRRRRQ